MDSYRGYQEYGGGLRIGPGSISPVIKYIIIASSAIFIIQKLVSFPIELIFGLTPELFFREFPRYIFQPVTYMFLHAGFFHIFFNMFALFIFGTYLEGKIDQKTFLAIYFASGIIGNVGYMITAPGSMIPGLGASGAIYGIMGALAMISPFAIIYFYGVPMPMLVASIVWIVTEFLGVFVPSDVAHGAHLGGLFFGIAVGLYLRSQMKKPKIY
jgi:membrane associated rhomboid family serine protease